jgi:hypothetical protein
LSIRGNWNARVSGNELEKHLDVVYKTLSGKVSSGIVPCGHKFGVPESIKVEL